VKEEPRGYKMPFVELSVRAQDFLDKLDKATKERIEKRLKNLENNPVPSDAKFIGRDNNEMVFRYRIGKFRALYKFKEVQKIILVTKIDKRDKVYD
jgi:mRNA-degrading endonuclease RelE of RelBE toxin-antitoxin system